MFKFTDVFIKEQTESISSRPQNIEKQPVNIRCNQPLQHLIQVLVYNLITIHQKNPEINVLSDTCYMSVFNIKSRCERGHILAIIF